MQESKSNLANYYTKIALRCIFTSIENKTKSNCLYLRSRIWTTKLSSCR